MLARLPISRCDVPGQCPACVNRCNILLGMFSFCIHTYGKDNASIFIWNPDSTCCWKGSLWDKLADRVLNSSAEASGQIKRKRQSWRILALVVPNRASHQLWFWYGNITHLKMHYTFSLGKRLMWCLTCVFVLFHVEINCSFQNTENKQCFATIEVVKH